MAEFTATFTAPADFFDALLGPRQHDAHVDAWRGHRWLIERTEAAERGNAACWDFVEQIRARERARRAPLLIAAE